MTDETLPGGRFAARSARVTPSPVSPAPAPAPRTSTPCSSTSPTTGSRSRRGLGTTPDRQLEILTYLPGASAHPPLPAAVRSVRALRSAARTVRAMHDVSEGFVPPQPGGWGYQ